MNIDHLLREQIRDLTDFNIENLNNETRIDSIGFDSLDFLSVQVALQRQFDFQLDLNRLLESQPNNYSELLHCIEMQYSEHE